MGIDVQSVDFRDGVTGGPFSYIFLFQTLEHLDHLEEAVRSLSKLGTPDAHAFISVPNIEYIEWAESNLGGIDMPPNHITGFSVEGLIRLFNRNGWMLIDSELQIRDTLFARCKFGAMRGLQFPRNRFQLALRDYLGIGSRNYSRLKLFACAGVVLLSDWTLFRKPPPENILIHVAKAP
jgi:hypothetical protein